MLAKIFHMVILIINFLFILTPFLFNHIIIIVINTLMIGSYLDVPIIKINYFISFLHFRIKTIIMATITMIII